MYALARIDQIKADGTREASRGTSCLCFSAALRLAFQRRDLRNRNQECCTLPDSAFTSLCSISISCLTPSSVSRQHSVSLSDALQADELVTRTASFVCLHEALALKAVSPQMHAAASPVAFSDASQLYVCGGSDGAATLRSAERFDPDRSCWEKIPDMIEQRRCAASVVLGSRLYIVGGSDGAKGLKSVERFDAEISMWESLPSMSSARVWGNAGAIAGFLYACAGTDSLYVPHKYMHAAERFDTARAVWSVLPDMKQKRRCAASATLMGSLYILGGSAGKLPLDSVERFDPQTHSWAELTPMPLARRNGACSAVAETVLCVCGGEDAYGCMNSCAMYDAEKDLWTSLRAMLQGRWWCQSEATKSHLYIWGGTDGARALASVERYDIENQDWEPMPPMLQGRVGAVGGMISDRARCFFL